MKRLLLFILTTLFFAPLFAQIPQEIKDKIDAKAKEVHPDNAAAQNKFVQEQIVSLDYLNSLTFPIPQEVFEKIKKAADEKFPFDYVTQTKFVTKQSESYQNILSYTLEGVSENDAKSIKETLFKANEPEYSKAEEKIYELSAIIAEVQNFPAPAGMDETTFTITKEVIKKKFPNDYHAQLDALKKQAGITNIAENNKDEKSSEADEKGGDQKLTLSELRIKMTETLKSSVLVNEADAVYGIIMEIKGKNFVVLPPNVYNPKGLTLKTIRGDTVTLTDFYEAQERSVILATLPNLPPDTKAVQAYQTELYRDLPTQKAICTYMRSGSPILANTSVSNVEDLTIGITSNLVTSIFQGTPMFDATGSYLIAIKVHDLEKIIYKRWNKPDDVRDLKIFLSRRKAVSQFYRIDGIETLQPIKPSKYEADLKALENLTNINFAVLRGLTDTFGQIQNISILATSFKNLKSQLLVKKSEAIFQTACRSYVMDLKNKAMSAEAMVKIDKVCKILKPKFETELELSRFISSSFEDTVLKSARVSDWLPPEVNRNQDK